MNNIFFTSDPHFGHTNIIQYCNRPFANVDEMNEALIANWNKVVQPNDRVIILGDLFFCRPEQATEIMVRLNGSKELIYGNHDKRLRSEGRVKKFFDRIHPDLYTETIDGIMVVMCHFPLLTWERAHRGSFMLHGHCHNTIKFDSRFRRMDVGVDAHDYAPVSWNEIKKVLSSCEQGDVRDY